MSEFAVEKAASKPKLMIIEDSADYRVLLKRLFSREGYDVFLAVNGSDALEQLKAASVYPDVILLDLMMPVMDGFEFRKKQLETSDLSKIPVILMTAHGDLQADPIKLGIHHFIRKPAEMDQLLKLVSSARSTSV